MESNDHSKQIRNVAVIGAGKAGRAFAFRCADSGFHVVLEDVMPANLRHAEEDRLALADEGLLAHIDYAGTVEDAVRDADLVIDFVPDELESKLEIFSMLDRMAPPRTILCTPTLALSITDLASCTYRADRCIALKSVAADLLSVDEMNVVRSRFLSEDTARMVEGFLGKLDLQVRFVADDNEPMLVKNASSNTYLK